MSVKRKKSIAIVLLIFFLATLVVISNFRLKQMAGGDLSLFINPEALWDFLSTPWDENMNYPLGGQTTSVHLIMPLILFFKLFSFLPILVVEYFYFIIMLSSIFLVSFYYFKKYLFRDNPASFFASLLYILNLFFFVSFLNYNIHLAFIMLPLLFILAHKIIENHYNQIIILVILISALFPTIFTNPPAAIPLLCAGLLYLLFLIIKHQKYKNPKKLLKPTVIFLLLFTLLNTWWLCPFIDTMFFGESSGISQVKANVSSIFKTTALYEAFRFSGNWGFNKYYLNFKKGKFNMLYTENNLFIISTYLIILFAYFPIIFAKKNKNTLFFLCLSLLGITLAKGTLGPLGKPYYYVWKNVPGMFMFREPYTKFMLIYVFSIAALLGYFILYVNKSKNKNLKILTCLLIVIAILIPSYPFLIGGFVRRHQAGPIKSYLVKLPGYLSDYKKYNSQEKLNHRILSLPTTKVHPYNWESGASIRNTALKYFSGKPVLTYGFGGFSAASNQIVDLTYDSLSKEDDDQKKFVNFLSLINVRNLIQENDTDWRWADSSVLQSPSQMKEIFDRLQKNGFIKKCKEFGKFDKKYLARIPNHIPEQWPHGITLNESTKKDLYGALYQELINKPALALYKIEDEFFLPKFYTSKTINIANNTDHLPEILSKEDYQLRTVAYFKNQNPQKNKILEMIQNTKITPILEFTKIKPTKYKIHVHQAQNSFPLIFSAAFHEDWKLYPNKDWKPNLNSQNLNNYQVVDANKYDQADKKELTTLIKEGWVSALGNERIEFISKNFHDTIQNDNLPKGHIWDTWFEKALPEENHLVANGYANSWWIDLNQIQNYVENPDGSINFEIIAEFRPQKSFYITLSISFIALIGCIGYLSWRKIKNKR